MEGADPRTDGELLVATACDPEAFATFYRRHVRGVLAFFRRRVGSAEVALDLTAETFAAALEASPRYELRPEPARNWLYGIAWNKLHEAGLELLDGLPAEQRDAVRARVIEGRGYDGIAADLRGSPSLVRKRVSRGLQRMRSDLDTPRGA
jgi:DNA-directed RNA polymerase specialized sigma24 family protein